MGSGREPGLVEAVASLDVLLRCKHPRRSELDALAVARSRAALAISLADGRSESPPESRLRVRFALAGLPPPVPQFEVRHDGRFVARVDLAWPRARVVVEYDGGWHSEYSQLVRDRARLNKLVAAGWTVFHVTAADLADQRRFDELGRKVRAALG